MPLLNPFFRPVNFNQFKILNIGFTAEFSDNIKFPTFPETFTLPAAGISLLLTASDYRARFTTGINAAPDFPAAITALMGNQPVKHCNKLIKVLIFRYSMGSDE
jgi:hypothetical protein